MFLKARNIISNRLHSSLLKFEQMKKLLIGAFVGGLIIFICQFLSWVVLDLHRPAFSYTEQQDEIMDFLNSRFSEDGSYLLPNLPPGSNAEMMEQQMKERSGKPWAVISYHAALNTDMTMNIIRVLVVNIVMIGLFCWILSRLPRPTFGTVFLISLFIGLIVFMNAPYTQFIWYETRDLNASLIDAIAGWGLVGLWLGRLYGKKRNPAASRAY